MLSCLIDIQLPSNNLHVTQQDKYTEHVIVKFYSTAIKLCKTRRTQTTTCTGVSPIININQRTCRFQTWPRYGEALYSMNESLLT